MQITDSRYSFEGISIKKKLFSLASLERDFNKVFIPVHIVENRH